MRANATGPLSSTQLRRIAGFGAAAAMLRFVVTDGGSVLALLLANAAGCALLGLLLARGRATPGLALGFCGSLTTFSGVATMAGAGARDATLPLLGDGGWLLPAGAAGAALVLAANAAAGAAALLAARRLAAPADRRAA